MTSKVINLNDNVKKYLAKADECAKNENHISALGFCFSALSLKKSAEVYMAIADIYADMMLYELSNQYWLYYLAVAPKAEQGVAYEELAINYFYLNNLLLSGYYFQKKIDTDGYLSNDNIDEEILNYFSEEHGEKKFRIVYPLERADYSDKIKEGKRLVASADFEGAINVLSEIPKGVKDYDKVADDLSLSYFLSGDVERAIQINRERLKAQNGYKFSAYCNLASMYHAQKNQDKSRYYYSLALSEPPANIDDEYRLATVCLEQHNEEKAIALIEKVLKERTYDTDTEYLLALAKINVGKYEEAIRLLKNLIKINPFNILWKFYLQLATRLKLGDKQASELLPVPYELDIPPAIKTEWAEKILQVASSADDSGQKTLKIAGDTRDVLEWSIKNYSGNDMLAKTSIFVLATSNRKTDLEFLKEKLLDTEVASELKVIIIYMLMAKKHMDKIALTVSGVFVKVKLNRPDFGKDSHGFEFDLAYSMCFAKAVVMGIKELDKLSEVAVRLCNATREKQITLDEAEASTLIIDGCKLPYFKALREICSLFGTNEIRISELKKTLYGENND